MSSKFYRACLAGKRAKVLRFLRFGSPDLHDGLCGACRGGHEDLVTLLIERGAHDFGRPLLDAALGGHLRVVQTIWPLVDPDDTFWRYSAFMDACKKGHLDIVHFLLENRAIDLSKRRYSRRMVDDALHEACRGGQLEVARLMIDQHGAGEGILLQRVLETVCFYGRLETVPLLLQRMNGSVHSWCVLSRAQQCSRRLPSYPETVYRLLVEHGSHPIDHWEMQQLQIPPLADDDLIELYHTSDRIRFGDDQPRIDAYLQWRADALEVLRGWICTDLARLIVSFL